MAPGGPPRHAPKYTPPQNTYASQTPVTDGERVYAYFANVGLYCYDWRERTLVQPLAARQDPQRMGHRRFARPLTGGSTSSTTTTSSRFCRRPRCEDRQASSGGSSRDEKSNWAHAFVWRNDGGPN